MIKFNIERLRRILIGNPLRSGDDNHSHIPKWKALAVLSSDALSSVAYASEEILLALAGFSILLLNWSLPITLMVIGLLFIITLSYQQTINAYPNGGGAYTVAKENLGTNAGLLAGAALLIDYVLTVSVSVSAGVENLSSAIPWLREHNVLIACIIILIIMILNLRGIRESSNVFTYPTYFFIFSILILIGAGIYKFLTGQPQPQLDLVHEHYNQLPIFLLLRSFSSGCTALTGVEAISNGVPLFNSPSQKNAKTTMIWMAIILSSLFLGISLLAHFYGVNPLVGEGTVISKLAQQVFGRNAMYYILQFSVALILFLAANTSFADFPRLACLLAKDRYLPHQLSNLGDRLVFSNGIILLSFSAMFLIFLFNGVTHRLIPLYAIGVFLSFSLSQVGMIVHHIHCQDKNWKSGMMINGLGALTTILVLVVIIFTKFTHGAWIVMIAIPLMVLSFKQIYSHYDYTENKIEEELDDLTDIIYTEDPKTFITIIPVSKIHKGVSKAVAYANSISTDVRGVYISHGNEMDEQKILAEWTKVAPHMPLVIIKDPYRSVIKRLLEYIDDVHEMSRKESINIIIPELIAKRKRFQFLHNQTTFFLKTVLIAKPGKIVTTVRHHLDH